MIRNRPFSLIFAVVFSLALSSCAGKTSAPVYTGPPCMDVLTLPQDLAVYAPAAGGAAPLIAHAEQEAAADRQKAALFKPWSMTAASLWVRQSLDKDFNMKPGRAFTESRQPFPQDAWQSIVANSNKDAYGKEAGPGITLRHTNLRAMPSGMRYYLKPDLPGEGYPFDYFQHTSLPPGTPIYICNVSRDGLWLLAESALSAGWIPAQDAASVDEAFMASWRSHPLAALVKDYVDIDGATGHIGTLLPAAGGDADAVFLPRRGFSGRAEASVIPLPPGSAAIVPVPLSPANVARVGNAMMAQPYGWGGLDEKRDCSALTRDLLTPFGIFLPRNSSRQARVGMPVDVTGMSNSEKEAAIIRQAAPFRSLVWLPGHIGLYLGVHNGSALMFHNMWGLRTRDAAGGCDGRAVVGKAVVTTLRPGVERPDLCNPGSFLDRIERAAVLP